MSAFTFGLMIGGLVGVPIACSVRNCRFELRLSQEELNDLTEKADRAGISKADFVRKTIKGKTIKEVPPVDVPLLIREVRRVGSNMDQILRFVNARSYLNVPELRRALEENRKVETMLNRVYGAVWQ